MYGPERGGYGPDPYKRGGYGGGGYGGGGYGGGGYGYGGDFFQECCGPNLIPIVAGILLFLVYCLFIPGFAAPYWKSHDTTTTEFYQGLWSSCNDPNTDTTADTKVCTDIVDDDFDIPDWLTATQALLCISLITLVIATLLFVYWICSYSRYFFVKAVFIILFFLTFILSLVGVIVYGANATDGDGNEAVFDWCFYLVVVSTSIVLFVPILLLCVPSRESFPRYGPRDRFGFEHPRPPPPGPMGPRPGYGPEPMAHVYPNSLPPRAKPYGGGSGYPYPSMPYSSRY